MPDANEFTINIMASVAQQERKAISDRTKAGLGSIKARIEREGFYVSKAGNTITKLGGTKTFTEEHRDRASQAIKAKASDHATKVKPLITAVRAQGGTLQATADALNASGLRTPRGAQWTPTAVARVEAK
jgi:DNA invertase Pin-like site-specific DNA recombinase